MISLLPAFPSSGAASSFFEGGSWAPLASPLLRRHTTELEGAPSFASLAKGGFLPIPLLFTHPLNPERTLL
jgi:hypothetical protein